MVVVPQELIDRLQTTAADRKPTNLTSENSLDAEMQQILINKNMDDSEKWKLYTQALHRFLHIATNKRQPISIPIVETEGDVQHSRRIHSAAEGGPVEEIVETFSKTYRSDARNLLRFMKREGSLISWDGDYSVYINGGKIPNSNLVDILNCIVKVRMRDYTPPGWYEVLNALKAMNVPKDYMNNIRALKEINAEYRSSFAGGSDDDDDDDLHSSTESILRTPLVNRLRSARGKRAAAAAEAAASTPIRATTQFGNLTNLDKWEKFTG